MTELCSFWQKQLAKVKRLPLPCLTLFKCFRWMPHNRQQLPAFPGFQKYILQDIRNTLCKISEMHKRVHIAHFQDICKCTGSLNEFSISGGSKWQMSALPKFELNLQICERSTHPHQFEMAWLYLIKYGLLAPPQNSDCLSKCILGATLHWDLINLTCW